MKNTIKKVLLCGLLLIGLSGYAIDDTPLKTARVEAIGDNLFALYVKTETSKVNVIIKDVYGNVLYSESLKKGKYYKKKYDMSALPITTYYVNVSDVYSVRLYKVKGSEIELVDEVEKSVLKERIALLKALKV